MLTTITVPMKISSKGTLSLRPWVAAHQTQSMASQGLDSTRKRPVLKNCASLLLVYHSGWPDINSILARYLPIQHWFKKMKCCVSRRSLVWLRRPYTKMSVIRTKMMNWGNDCLVIPCLTFYLVFCKTVRRRHLFCAETKWIFETWDDLACRPKRKWRFL